MLIGDFLFYGYAKTICLKNKDGWQSPRKRRATFVRGMRNERFLFLKFALKRWEKDLGSAIRTPAREVDSFALQLLQCEYTMTEKKEQNEQTPETPLKPQDPLHGVTLKNMLEDLVEYHGYPYLAEKVKIKVFDVNPTFNGSLKFLRKTPWAREKVEKLYIYHFVIRKEKERPKKEKYVSKKKYVSKAKR